MATYVLVRCYVNTKVGDKHLRLVFTSNSIIGLRGVLFHHFLGDFVAATYDINAL